MIAQLKNWFGALSSREQWLVAIAGGLVAALVLIYGVIVSTYSAIQNAETELTAATERRGRLEALAEMAKNGGGSQISPAAVTSGANVESLVSESATAAGFEISDGAASGNDEFAFRLASAKAGPLLAWLTGLEVQGINVSEIRLQQGQGGFVSADVRVQRRP